MTRERGRVHEEPGGIATVATIHPSAILRAPDDDRPGAMDGLVRDLRSAAALL